MNLSNIVRPSGRKFNQIRKIKIEKDIMPNATGSCLIHLGNTKVICAATIEETVPPFLRGKGEGWVTAEYSMLPASTSDKRNKRESTQGKITGRTQEIQRLIGRSLRIAINPTLLGERQIIIDCDVLNADGGTRTASITGGYVAMCLAIKKLLQRRLISSNPIVRQIAAISCGLYKGVPVVDMDYSEDSQCSVDANFVCDENGDIIEIQFSAEQKPFSEETLNNMLNLARVAIQDEIIEVQSLAIS